MSDTPAPQQKSQRQEETLLEVILQLSLRYWYWFVISLIICLGTGYLITKTLSYKYNATATILLKGSETDTSSNFKADIFEGMGVSPNTSSVESEIVQLKSSRLIKQVVEELNLNILYSVKPLLRRADIYGANPIELEIVEQIEDKDFALCILPNDTESFYFIPAETYKTGDPLTLAKFGDKISINGNKVRIKQTSKWGNGHQNETIQIKVLQVKSYTKNIISRLLVQRTDTTTGSVKLSITGNNQERGRDILSHLIKTYKKESIAQKNQEAINTEKFIDERITIIYETLGTVDGKLANIRKEHDLISVDNLTVEAYQESSGYSTEVSKLDMQIDMIKAVRDDMQLSDNNVEAIPPNRAFADLGLAEQINNYNTLVIKYKELRRNAGANNPIIIQLSEEINISNKNAQIAIKNLISNLEFRKRQIQHKLKEIKTELAAIPAKERIVKDVMREQGIKEQLYLYLLNKRESTNLQLAVTDSDVIIIEPAESGTTPIAPNPPLIILISGLVGLVLPAGFIFIFQALRNKVETRDDIINHCDIPLIGILPSKPKKQKDKQLIIKEDARDALNEGFRVVANNVDYFIQTGDENKGGKVIHITSTTPGEGKSFISLNLALALSFTNRKVLLIDLDMRRRILSKLIDKTPEKIGLARYLRNHDVSLDELITKGIDDSQLDFIKLGSSPPNAAQLLTSARFSNLIEKLRSRYDLILIDSAPYFAVADSQIINKFADVTIWVIRSGKLTKNILPELEQLRTDKKVHNMALLLNDAELKSKGYGYSYGYGYGYGEKA